jgi:hypothetical protein
MTPVMPESAAVPTQHLDTDYLILGAGAMGMAFADVVLTQDPEARIVLVDRHADPGGHWNDAYPFVRLHQPAAFYGLNSTCLGQGGDDLASGPEIVAYYKNAMDRFVATGRVRFLPMSEYHDDGRIVSTVDRDRVATVTADRRIVDSTYMQVAVPSVCPPRYTVEPGVTVVPPNDLAQIRRPWQRYVVIGAGKTGIDAILFLLDQGVAPERIQWIVSNDAWLWDRATIQPGVAQAMIASLVRSIADGTDIDDVFLRLERQGVFCRIDTQSLPGKWRCATVDRRELAELRRIDDVIRLGRVQCVGNGEIRLERGSVAVAADTLFVDCSANGLAQVDPQPLFSAGRVTLQSVMMCQQTFSAALIARLELLNVSDEKRNRICTAVPHPERKEDLLGCMLTSSRNMINCNRRLPLWLRRSRLYIAHYEALHRYLFDGAKLALQHRRAVTSIQRMT